jgi:hypothetical protein
MKSSILIGSLKNVGERPKPNLIPTLSSMSKNFWVLLGSLGLILQIFTLVQAQDLTATITVGPDSTVAIEGTLIKGRTTRHLPFTLEYAGIEGLGERVSDVKAWNSWKQEAVPLRRLIAGEYLADAEFDVWSYKMSLVPRKEAFAAAHLSWVGQKGGVLMLYDLLPELGKDINSATVRLRVPEGWDITSSEKKLSGYIFEVSNIEKAVFAVGPGIRKSEIAAGKSNIGMSISDEWAFTDREAAEISGSIFKEYERVFGSAPTANVHIVFRRFPSEVGQGMWEADTRGTTITLISSDMPFKSQSLQRLHEQLRHEIFHLWIPNGVTLKGSYDWFYEGMALYQSLKTGVSVNRIRFEDMLNTLSRAHDLSAEGPPLITLSENRWKGANSQIYARGMMAAFLIDLATLRSSKGKRSVSDLLREIYEKYRPPRAPAEGNQELLAFLSTRAELRPVIEGFISGTKPLDWTPLLEAAGLESTIRDQLTELKVKAKPSGGQKKLLDKLGYNNWRKLSEKQ